MSRQICDECGAYLWETGHAPGCGQEPIGRKHKRFIEALPDSENPTLADLETLLQRLEMTNVRATYSGGEWLVQTPNAEHFGVGSTLLEAFQKIIAAKAEG